MKLRCSKGELLEGISTVQKAVTGRTTLPILEGILITCYNDRLTLTATDLDLGIETQVNCEIISKGSVVLNSRLLGDIVRRLPDMDIEIEVDSLYNTTISCGNSKFNIIGQNPDEYPELPVINENILYRIPQDLLKNMIRQTIFAAAQDETRPILTGVLFEVRNSVLTMVALDAYRLALRRANLGNADDITAVIPGKTLGEVGKILAQTDDDIAITFTPNHILFTINNTRVISRLLDGEFMNYRQIIPEEFKTKVKVNTKLLLDSIERASLLAKEGKTNLIKMEIGNDEIIITSNSQLGNVHEQVGIEFEGSDIKIAFNSKYFIDVLKIIDTDEIYLELSSSVSPCILKTEDWESHTYLILPVRLISQ
ncbi:DNA polymerase III subunit beta [Oxobacter pfennigii]|uniref:Beta sliding clamp n=1 Tax=Oxobacter pfennigii TaxID=36849 RepID=A0A0P8W517_9CLOT|nr:DNA polymerase III subunit beta [Oxobacter pfennigii]KPU42956.1 DNA polymerase III subunit beta [Oxobacter pfennigii]